MVVAPLFEISHLPRVGAWDQAPWHISIHGSGRVPGARLNRSKSEAWRAHLVNFPCIIDASPLKLVTGQVDESVAITRVSEFRWDSPALASDALAAYSTFPLIDSDPTSGFVHMCLQGTSRRLLSILIQARLQMTSHSIEHAPVLSAIIASISHPHRGIPRYFWASLAALLLPNKIRLSRTA